MNAPRFALGHGPAQAYHVPRTAVVPSRTAGHTLSLLKGVAPPKSPVLLNYGIEECRSQVERQRNPASAGPIYPGSTCHPELDPGQVKFTCREKLDQASSAEALWRGRKKRPKTADSPKGADVARGIVKWLVDVVDETGETVALATILTMVKKLDQN